MTVKIEIRLWNLLAHSNSMGIILFLIPVLLRGWIIHNLHLCSLLNPNSDTRQALAFIGGHAAFSVLRKLSKTSDLCTVCFSPLTEDKTLEIEDLDSNFTLIQLLDRGGLK